MPHSMRQSKWDAWWVDVLMAAAIFASSQCLIIAGGHGIGILGMFLLDGPAALLSPFWSGHAYTALVLLAGAFAPFSIKRWVRFVSVLGGFSYTVFLITLSEWKEATAISAAPVILMLLVLIWVSCGAEMAHMNRRARRSSSGIRKRVGTEQRVGSV